MDKLSDFVDLIDELVICAQNISEDREWGMIQTSSQRQFSDAKVKLVEAIGAMQVELLQLRRETEWIPVSKPPELMQDVICCSVKEPDCGAYPGYYGRGDFFDFYDEPLIPVPTHYRLIYHDLPVPPKEGG